MTTPWAHQEEAICAALPFDGYMFAHDMAAGKSFEAIELANRIDARRVLILCPKSVIPVWPKEFAKHSRNKFQTVPLIKGTVKKKAAVVENALRFQAASNTRLAVIINHESCWRSPLGPTYKNKKIVKKNVLLSTKWDLVVADESHRAKSPSSKFSWFLYKISQTKAARRRLALTGTPMPHALSANCPVLTPSGWQRIKDLSVGDYVIGSDGNPTEVIGVWPQGVREIYSVEFSDGAKTPCTKDHLWQVASRGRTRRGLPSLIRRTEELPDPLPLPNSRGKSRIAERSLFGKDGSPRWSIPIPSVAQFSSNNTPLDPYLLGVLLGNGHLGHSISFVTPDQQVADEVSKVLPGEMKLVSHGRRGLAFEFRITSGKKGGSLKGPKRGPAPNSVAVVLDQLGLRHHRSEDKFIPDCYLWNTLENRLSLLQGLCDTDGSSYGSTSRYTTTSKKLSDGVKFLVRSLGGYVKTTPTERKEVTLPNGKKTIGLKLYTLHFRMALNPFRLERKRSKFKIPWRKPRRNIIAIKPTGYDEAVCITVAAEDGLYVAKDFVVTHNSPLDIYAQFRFLDWSIFKMTYTEFRDRYAVIRDMGDFKKVVAYQRQDELNAIFYSRAHLVKKRDVLDLPPVMHEYRTCELCPKAQALYDELDSEFVAWLQEQGEKVSVQNALVKLLRLAQLAGGFIQFDSGESQIIDNSKLELLEEIFADLPTDEPIVVFSRFTNEIQRIKKLAEKMMRPAAELSGQMNQLDAWQQGKFNVLAAQIRSGGIGIDLTRAHYTVYYSTGYSLGDYEQSLARMDRPGQTKEGVYYHLNAERTVDMDVAASLAEKKNVVESILSKRR